METGASVKFQLENEIERVEEERNTVEAQLQVFEEGEEPFPVSGSLPLYDVRTRIAALLALLIVIGGILGLG